MNQQPTSLFFCKSDEEGLVYCPQCGNLIDPNDISNSAYEVLEAVLDEQNELVRIIVKCHCCKSEVIIVLE